MIGVSQAPIIAFFSNKSGVGKTSLVYHLAWKYADLQERILVVDLNPQAHLTSMFIDEGRLEKLWGNSEVGSVYQALRPLTRLVGDIANPHLYKVPEYFLYDHSLALIPGNVNLYRLEAQMSESWLKAMNCHERYFQTLSAFWSLIQKGAKEHRATIVLVDLGPNFGALNRAALLAADHVVMSLTPDIYSLRSLEILGCQSQKWREGWRQRRAIFQTKAFEMPDGKITPLGYTVSLPPIRLHRPNYLLAKRIKRIPETYRKAVLDAHAQEVPTLTEDPHCLAVLKDYWTLMPMALEARKPMFHLKPADGALGAHLSVAREAGDEFERLAKEIRSRISDDASPAKATA